MPVYSSFSNISFKAVVSFFNFLCLRFTFGLYPEELRNYSSLCIQESWRLRGSHKVLGSNPKSALWKASTLSAILFSQLPYWFTVWLICLIRRVVGVLKYIAIMLQLIYFLISIGGCFKKFGTCMLIGIKYSWYFVIQVWLLV